MLIYICENANLRSFFSVRYVHMAYLEQRLTVFSALNFFNQIDSVVD